MKTVKDAVRKVARSLGVDVVRYQDPWSDMPWDFDAETAQIVRSVRTHTMTTPVRIFTLCEAVKYISTHNIAGDIVECGVWRGGSMMAVARTLLRLKDTSRHLHLFDTYEGMTSPSKEDVDALGVPATDIFGADGRTTPDGKLPWLPESVEGVRQSVLSTGYPDAQCHFIKGKVEETLPGRAPQSIALLRLDTDWYESTRHELEHLFPRLVNGGVLILDDYGYWQGARQAVDEYLQTHRIALLLHRIDESCRMATVTKS